jgi:hypothetical protein
LTARLAAVRADAAVQEAELWAVPEVLVPEYSGAKQGTGRITGPVGPLWWTAFDGASIGGSCRRRRARRQALPLRQGPGRVWDRCGGSPNAQRAEGTPPATPMDGCGLLPPGSPLVPTGLWFRLRVPIGLSNSGRVSARTVRYVRRRSCVTCSATTGPCPRARPTRPPFRARSCLAHRGAAVLGPARPGVNAWPGPISDGASGGRARWQPREVRGRREPFGLSPSATHRCRD